MAVNTVIGMEMGAVSSALISGAASLFQSMVLVLCSSPTSVERIKSATKQMNDFVVKKKSSWVKRSTRPSVKHQILISRC